MKTLSARRLVDAIRTVAAGGLALDQAVAAEAPATGPNPLTERECEILRLVDRGVATSRIAEELFMQQMTTGASNDFERATEIARRMVTQWGMSDELGTMVYGENEGEVFLGRSVTTHKSVSEATMQKVDAEIRRIIDQQYRVARKLLEDNRDKVEAMAKALLEWETIDADQIADIMEGKPPRAPKPPASQTAAKPPAGTSGTEGAAAPTPAA